MPRIEPVAEDRAGIALRLAYRYAEKRYGKVPEPMAVWAHAPGVMWTWVIAETLAHYTWRRLPRELGELAVIRAASVVGCTWCLDFGSLVARFEGVSEDKLRGIHDWANAPVFDAHERLVLEYADAMTATPMSVDDGLVIRLREVLGEDATVELTALIALENQRARFNLALGIASQGFSPDVCAAPSAQANSGGR